MKLEDVVAKHTFKLTLKRGCSVAGSNKFHHGHLMLSNIDMNNYNSAKLLRESFF